MTFNVEKLFAELTAAGIPIAGCASTGRIDFKAEATQAHRDQAAAILAAHDPADTQDQKIQKSGHDRLRAAVILKLARGAEAPAWVDQVLDEAATRIETALGL